MVPLALADDDKRCFCLLAPSFLSATSWLLSLAAYELFVLLLATFLIFSCCRVITERQVLSGSDKKQQ